ncbi:MAG: DegT/DnrJ/EryC1/StrS family aminotransferase [Candidatus Rokuibacteriota bacterium]
MPMMPIIRPTLPDLDELADLLRASWEAGLVTAGPLGRAFEQEVCHRTGAAHAVAVSSCTAGLMLSVQALDLPPGAEVVVPSFTFAATAQALVWNGLVPVFCDCRPDDLTLDPEDVERNLSPRTAAICAAYVYGLPPDVEGLSEVAARHGLPLYFDSAQGLGAEYHGTKAGAFGTSEIFSLSPTKVVTAVEGGVICTGDARLAERLRSMRDYGKDPRNGEDMVDLGLSARMSELHAAVGLLSLRHLDELVKARLALIESYRLRLGRLPGCGVQALPRDRTTSGNYFVLFVTDRARLGRDEVQAALKAKGIQTKRYFHPPLHEQTLFRRVACRLSEHLEDTERASREALALPLYGHMTREQLDHVCREVERVLA